jgi:TolB-like protein
VTQGRILRFGPFRLDAADARLWCESQPVRLTTKALQVLSYLAERPGQLVTKEELFSAVWLDTVVSDATLTSNIKAVRQALRDDPRRPQYLETVYRRGFRFIAPTAATDASGPSAELPVHSTQALPLPEKPSLIVLPFVNMSHDPDQEYFSDGLTEVLTGSLSKISSLFVIARNSAFTYKGKAVKVQDVGREMGVRYVLEGSVQKADQRVRTMTQLIEAATGYHLWSEQYDRPLQDLFALQDEIVQKIVTTLKLQLTWEEQGWVVRKHTDNLAAYDSLLRGGEYFFRYTKEANAQARQMFEQALALDPQYAEAYVALGWTYYIEWTWRWTTDPQTLERAWVLVRQALALDDSLPRAHSLLSVLYTQHQQPDQAIAA